MLNEKIENDLKNALKAKEALKVSTLRFLKSAMHNLQIEKREELKEEDIVGVIKKQIKQRQDSIEEFKKGNRADLVEKETEELKILQQYLPQELSEAQLRDVAKSVISELNATSAKDMGRVIKEVMARASGRADGRLASAIVKEELSKIAETN
jgi:uncharacterized protein YqeY